MAWSTSAFAGVWNSRVGPPGQAPTHPWSSCTTDRARRSWRCRGAGHRLRAARRDRPSGHWPDGRHAGMPGTSCRADRARPAVLAHSGAATPVCCTARCDDCGSTAERGWCSDHPSGWSERRKPCRASRPTPPLCGVGYDAGDARMHARRHRDERDWRGRWGLFRSGATPREPGARPGLAAAAWTHKLTDDRQRPPSPEPVTGSRKSAGAASARQPPEHEERQVVCWLGIALEPEHGLDYRTARFHGGRVMGIAGQAPEPLRPEPRTVR